MSEDDKKPWYEQIKDSFHKLEMDVSYMRGELDEMKRHNSKMIKFMMAIILALLAIVGALIGIKIPLP